MSSAANYAGELARALLAQGRLADAEAAFRVALYERPEDGMLYTGLGDCLRGLGKRADALDAYVAAVEFGPDNADAHYGLGLCELHPLRRAQAFEEAARIETGHIQAHLAHGEALLLLGRGDDGLFALRRAQALAPDDLELISRAGESLFSAGHLHDAALFLEQAIAEHPIGDHSANGLGRLYRSLARALVALGRDSDASEALRAADYLLPEEEDEDDDDDVTDVTEPDRHFGAPTSPAAVALSFEHYAELTDPDADRTDPDGERTAPPG